MFSWFEAIANLSSQQAKPINITHFENIKTADGKNNSTCKKHRSQLFIHKRINGKPRIK
jgi:hypothetical protein